MKKTLAISVLLFLLVISGSFFAGKTFAAVALPQIAPVPCLDDDTKAWKDPEFNSQRPYQASPCRDAPYAAMCGNSIKVVIDHVHTDWDENKCANDECPVNQPVQHKNVVIDLSGVKLPILGNTQQVVNSQNTTDSLDDAQKVNEYASWYLNGVNQKAEYGADTAEQLVNFSGPAKKLLPSVIQELDRFASLQNAGVKPDYTDSDTGKTTQETLNHNQIVVCTAPEAKNFLGFKIVIPWISKEQPIPCYDGHGKAQGNPSRLLDWWNGKLSKYNTVFNLLLGWTGSSAWNSRVPPFPWQFSKDIYYQKAYNEWRGKQCNILFGKLFCFDVPGVTSNFWADFYQYIPLANTVDKKGKEYYDNVHVDSERATLARHQENSSIDGTIINSVPRLFYPHTQDVLESTENLNKTFIPAKGVTNSIGANTEDTTTTCQILNVRTNAGDDLTFDDQKDKQEINFTVSYKVESIKCTSKDVSKKDDLTGQYYTVTIHNCDADISASLDLTTLAPNLNNIWQDTVAGNGSTFRKIFPKVQDGAPVNCIADIPGVSQASYTLNQGLSSNSVSPDIKVLNPGGSTASSPEIYFPHLGSVYEYFLKGIQTALRPKGYGDPLVNGTLCNSSIACGELPPGLPKATGSCNVGGVSSRVGDIPQSLKDIVSAAAETYKVPPNLILGVMFGESAFNRSDKNDRYSKYDWTDANVKNWATCQPLPGCTGPTNSVVPFTDDWAGLNKKIIGDLQKVDPGKKVANACNLLDATYALAYTLHDNADGGMSFKCFNMSLNATIPTSCTWTPNQYISAIKVWETGYQPICYTRVGSCAGGTNIAPCSANEVNSQCESLGVVGGTSHTACVWDVAHGK